MSVVSGPRILTSAVKCLETLKALTISGEPMSLSKIAEATNRPKPTIYQHLQTLVEAEVLEQVGAGHYCVSFNVIEIARAALIQHGAGPELASAVTRLAAASGEATTLAVREGENALLVHRAALDNSVGAYLSPGSRMPLTKSASGAILLAFDRTIEGDKYLAKDYLERIRAQGYAVTSDEFLVGITTIAVPVLLRNERVSALSIAAPTARFDMTSLTQLISESNLTNRMN